MPSVANQSDRGSASDSKSPLPGDAELLHQFCQSGDEESFQAIVVRHQAMVFSVCTSVLKNRADAEDAFQATFFLLARKAGRIRQRNSLAGWLHRVALRTSLTARRRQAARPVAELPPADSLPEKQLERVSARDGMARLHEELDRLPARYRLPLIVSYFEGASRKEAAAALALTEGALKTRLERARKMLRRRLGAVGFGAFAVIALCPGAVSAASGTVSNSFVASTVCIATKVKLAWSQAAAAVPSAGRQAISLAQGVQKTMFVSAGMKAASSAILGLGIGLAAMAGYSLAQDAPGQVAGTRAAVVLNGDGPPKPDEVEQARDPLMLSRGEQPRSSQLPQDGTGSSRFVDPLMVDGTRFLERAVLSPRQEYEGARFPERAALFPRQFQNSRILLDPDPYKLAPMHLPEAKLDPLLSLPEAAAQQDGEALRELARIQELNPHVPILGELPLLSRLFAEQSRNDPRQNQQDQLAAIHAIMRAQGLIQDRNNTQTPEEMARDANIAALRLLRGITESRQVNAEQLQSENDRLHSRIEDLEERVEFYERLLQLERENAQLRRELDELRKQRDSGNERASNTAEEIFSFFVGFAR